MLYMRLLSFVRVTAEVSPFIYYMFTPHLQTCGPISYYPLFFSTADQHPLSMSSHAYMDEHFFDRDGLTPSLHTSDVPEIEPHSGIRPEQLDNGWLTASSELWDLTANHEATLGRTAAASTGSLKNCYNIPEPDQGSTSYVVLDYDSLY